MIILAIVHPIDRLGEGEITSGTEAFVNAFLTGYNTGDVGTGIICAGIFIEAFRNKGYTERKEYKKAMFGIIAVGFALLFVVYGGLAYLGAQGTKIYPADVDTTFLLTDLVRRMAGYGGSVVLSLAVIFVMSDDCGGMIATTGEWVEGWTKGKLSYKTGGTSHYSSHFLRIIYRSQQCACYFRTFVYCAVSDVSSYDISRLTEKVCSQ